MTELQMGLIGLGALAVVGVLAYNKWQEMRQRRQAESVLKADHPDVLLDGGAPAAAADMAEPGGEFGEAAPPEPEFSAGEPVAAEARVEPVLRYEPDPEELAPLDAPIPDQAAPIMPEPPLPVASEAFQSEPEPVGAGGPADHPADAVTGAPADLPAASPAGAVAEAAPFLSPRIDFIAAIDVVEPVAAQRIVDAPRDALARVRKPVRWIGYDEASGEWQPISARQGGEYRHIRAGLQLVDRQGAVSENDLAIFASAMQDLADQLTGIADLPARQQAFETAMQLDQFCAGVDIQIGINVISQGQAFPGTKLRALAEAAGMTIDGSRRRFVRRDEDGNVLYALLNQEEPGFSAETMRSMSTHGLTFLLDVPCVAHGERVFNQMVDLARRFADVLHGVLVDDNRRPLSEAALEPIRRQIAQYQAMLAARQLPAGTPLTQRLFS